MLRSVLQEPQTGLIREVGEETFAAEVLQSPVPVLVDFWAPWCRPCRILAPALDWIALSFTDRARVVRVNTDLNVALAERFNIRGLPTIVVIADGRVLCSTIGVRPAEEYVRQLERALGH